MKKLITLIFALCISLGAWANVIVSTEGSTTIITSTSTDQWIDNGTAWQILAENTKFVGDFSSFDWADCGGKCYNTGMVSEARFDFSGATGVEVIDINTLLKNSINTKISKLVLPANISIPTDISSLGVSDAIFKYVFVTNSSGVSSVYVTSKVTDASMLSYEFTASRIESITNNGINLTGDPDAMQVIHDYLVANSVPEEKITIPFVFRGNLDVTGGSVAQNISDAIAAHPDEITDDAITSITVTSGTLSSDDLIRLGKLTNLETIILPNGTASFPDLSSLTNFKKVVYKDTKGNYNVLIPKRGSSLDVSVIGDYDVAGTNVTITGELNGTDLASINGIANASMINLSGITVASGSSITSLDARRNAAIVLPSSITKAEFGTLQCEGEDNMDLKYKCLAYPDATDANKLHLYAIQSSTIEHLYPLVNTTSTLYFEPWYNNDGTFNAYMLDNNVEAKNIPTYVGKLPFADVDFSMVSVWLSTDFSVLNSNTRFITIPINGTDYDFTAEGVPYNNDGESYKYSNNIDVVSTFKSPGDTMHGRSCKYKGKTFEATENTNITYVRHAGTLGAASAYVNENMMSATRQIFVGNLNSSDVSAMAMMRATTFDFVDASISANDMKAFHNGYVHYLTLPDNEESAITATSADVCNYRDMNNNTSSKCPALLCVGAYNTTTNTLTTWSSAPGHVYPVTSIIRPQLDEYTDANGQTHTNQRGVGNICNTLENVVMSGRLNGDDISVNNGNGLESASIKTADLTNAYFPDNDDMNLSTAGWTGMTSIKLPTDARMLTIPANCFYNCQSLNDLCIPSNFEEIGESAFVLTNITHIYTTPYNGDANGNGADNFTADEFDDQGNLISSVYDHGANTITLSSNLKKIHTKAFSFNDNTLVTDVYVLAKTAPECEVDAFSSFMLMGNGGFAGNWAHPVTRENYKNNNGYFMILHFPNDAVDPENYTDIHRNYSLVDETGLYDGNGNLVRWPNHTEIYRAYNQAMTGATWNDWIYLTENDFNQTKQSYKGQYTQEYMEGGLDWAAADELAQAKVEALYPSYEACKFNTRLFNGNLVDAIATFANGDMTADYYETGDNIPYETTPSYPMASSTSLGYTGWHQFILADYSRFADVQKSTNYDWGGYYTLCFPYDLTKEQVIKYLGAPASIDNVQVTLDDEVLTAAALPKVYTLKSVTRNNPNINLQFSKDLMKLAEGVDKKTIKFDEYGHYDYNGSISESAYIKAGYPYLVKPILPADKASSVTNLGQYILSIAEDLSSNQITSKYYNAMAPKIDHKVIATSEGGDVTWEALKTQESANATPEYEESNYNYYFQGTYTKEYMPIYCYFLGAGTTKIYRNMLHTRVWNPFTCIIIGKCKDGAVEYEMGGSSTDTSDNARGKFSTLSVLPHGNNDDFVGSTNSVKYKFTIEEDGDDVLVAIDKLDGDTLNNVTETGKVYNVTGQYVGESLNGLSKGMYIINGKKILVK